MGLHQDRDEAIWSGLLCLCHWGMRAVSHGQRDAGRQDGERSGCNPVMWLSWAAMPGWPITEWTGSGRGHLRCCRKAGGSI